ncbi:MAG: helix-turn-helix domain-containing protein, partial [Myxococcota bacterium]
TCVLALSSTLSARPYPAWVEASSAGSVFLHILGNTFHRLLEGETAFRSFVLTSMSDRIFELMTTLESLGTSTILQRVAALLLARAGEGVEVRATQAEIAAELGTAREVVFRAIRTLSSRGLLETRRGRVRLLGRAQLQALAKPTAE